MAFRKFLLHDKILSAIQEAGLTTPTPIQDQAMSSIMEGRDVRASAQTGTGKTAAFLLPALHRVSEKSGSGRRGPRVLILTPTRELAMQIAKEAARFGAGLPHLKTVCVFGGMPYPLQNRQLKGVYDILVATPGRLIDHLERQRIDLSSVEMVVLDEADRMLDMGFIGPVEHIISHIPPTVQILLFSATLKKEVVRLSERLLKNPVEITITPERTKHEQIEQHFHAVDNISQKHELLEEILKDEKVNQAIIFTATKRAADELADHLSEAGHDVSALHGDMNQRQRTRTLKALREGRIKVLVATDVAARGIDVLTISHVINFDLPMSSEDYVHRIGRTGRAGAAGIAISFASRRDRQALVEIERFTGQSIPLCRQASSGRSEPRRSRSSFPPRRHGSRNFGRRETNGSPDREASEGMRRPRESFQREEGGYKQTGSEGGYGRRSEGFSERRAGEGHRGSPKRAFQHAEGGREETSHPSRGGFPFAKHSGERRSGPRKKPAFRKKRAF